MTLAELLLDPVRARIYLEVLLNEEVTAQQLKDKIDISRSTMSHHLSRFVEDKVFKVRVKETGRPVKFYSRNPDFREEVIIDGKDHKALNERIAFLGSASAHLNVVSNLLQERAERVRTTKRKSKGQATVTFTFTFMSKEESKIWNEEYQSFQKRFEERRQELTKSSDSLEYIGYGGLTPTN